MAKLIIFHASTREIYAEISHASEKRESCEKYAEKNYSVSRLDSPFASWWNDAENMPKDLIENDKTEKVMLLN